MIKKFLLLLPAAVLLLSCGGRGRGDSAAGPMKVTAGIAPVAWLVDQIGGDSVEVSVFLPQGSDAESFEPQLGKLRDLEGSSLFVATGLLPFEGRVAESAGESAGVEVVRLADGLDLITGTHGGGEPDPHVWVSVRNLRAMSGVLLEAMRRARPSAAETFDTNWNALDARLDSLDRAVAAGLAEAGNPSFLVWHPSLSYFARDYGLRQISVGFEGKEGSAVGTRDRIDAALAESPKVYFLQADEDPRAASTLPVGDATKKVSINLMAPDWESEIIKVADALRQ